jgi:hypothetical protein
MSRSSDSRSKPTLSDAEVARLARRKLLRLAAYTAPAVIGIFTTRDAAAQSCGPYSADQLELWHRTNCQPSDRGPSSWSPGRGPS